MPTTPLISVIVPTRNRAALLARLLGSLRHLRYPGWELLVVDDGSTDGTAAVVEQGRATGLPVRYRRQAWGGMGSARNQALALARGEIVAFTDDDCTVNPGWLEAIAEAFEQHPEALGVQGRTVTVRERMTPFTRQVEQLEGGQPYRTCNIAYRTDTLRALGGFDPRLIRGEDVVMGARVLERGPIAFAPDAVVCHPPRPKEWADRRAWRTLLASETHFKRAYPRYAAQRSRTLSVQRANHVVSRWLLLPIRRYWRWHRAYARRHPVHYARQVPRMVGEKMALLSLLPSFLRQWAVATRSRQRGEAPAGYAPIQPLQERHDGPLISVVIPTRNRRAPAERLLDALLAQTYPHREIIVVDDASTDGTAEALRREDVTVLRQTRPAGGYAARNHGWQAARGEIVAFTDDDCVPHSGWLAALVRAFEADEHVVGVQGVTLAAPGEITPFTHQIEQTRPGPPYRTCNIGYRRDVLARLGGFDDRLRWYADNILGYQARHLGPIGFAPDALVFHPPRPREWRTEATWLARFRNDAAHRRRLQELKVEHRLAPAVALPLALWVARPLVKQAGAHVRYATRHPLAYARGIVPMAHEKMAMTRALRQYWRVERPVMPAEPLAPLGAEPCVSVVVVTRGRSTLRTTLEALTRQTWPWRETVLVGHGTETVGTIAERFGARYVHVAAGATLGAARQAGVEAARGEIVAFTDDDCVPDPGWFMAIVRRFTLNPNLWGVQGRTEAESGAADTYAVRVGGPDRLYRTCNIAYRREAIIRAGGFDTGFHRWFEDTALGARVTAHGVVAYDPAARVWHRAMPREPFDAATWRSLLEDERRLAGRYATFYRTVRGPAPLWVVAARWGIGSAVTALVRAAPRTLTDPGGVARLLRTLARERAALVQALWEDTRSNG